jgi:hypothetical protein
MILNCIVNLKIRVYHLRSFCTNNNAAYVAVEETYGDYSYNGHAKKNDAL